MEQTKKLTKKDYYNALLKIDKVAKDEALVKFINHELELLAKKNSGEKKETATQIANKAIKETILATLERVGRGMTISEMQKADAELGELSTSKASALVRQLKEEGIVERYEDKRKAYFKLV